ncbi:hypothetical protein HK101_001800 [Irineochytrium annulatum]|nr:hypothetical protein HK101_001800 [Irineochytrium annulatum]
MTDCLVEESGAACGKVKVDGVFEAHEVPVKAPWIERTRSRVITWWDEKIMMGTYPAGSSPEQRLAMYFDRRDLPAYKVPFVVLFSSPFYSGMLTKTITKIRAGQANFFQILGLGLSAVITGEFSGWNNALVTGGFGGMIMSTWLAGFMYLCLILSLAEMALSIPVVGGNFAFSRAIGGPWLGFLVGNSECIEYVMFISLVLVDVSQTLCEILSIDHHTFAPLIWIIFLLICVTPLALSPRLPWDIMAYLSVVCLAQIVIYCVLVALTVGLNVTNVVDGVSIDEKFSTPGRSVLFPQGAVGVLGTLPSAAWWFTGVECIALAGTEAKDGRKDVPAALMTGWGLLFAAAVALTVFTLMAAPGVAAMAAVDYPMVWTLTTRFGAGWRRPGLAMMFPAFLANGIAMVWTASRQTWALSRAGYLPQFMSLTTGSRERVPLRAALFVCAYAFIMATVTLYLHGTTGTSTLLLDLTVLSALMTYIGVAAVYILFCIRHPKAPRPFHSPLRIWGGIFLLLISSLVIMEQLSTTTVYPITLLAYALKMIGSGSFFVFMGKNHLLPTEDMLIYIFWTKAHKASRVDVAG